MRGADRASRRENPCFHLRGSSQRADGDEFENSFFDVLKAKVLSSKDPCRTPQLKVLLRIDTCSGCGRQWQGCRGPRARHWQG